jgi:hypothetical protein
MAPLPTLALARLIVRNYRQDDFSLIIVDGNLRVGKSAYAMKAIDQAHEYIFGKGVKTMSDYKWVMGWNPDDVIDLWMATEDRQPCFIWDDAGYWLHSMNWNDPLMISIQKYFNVVGTDFNTIILTTPSPKWVLSKIANMPEMIRIKCTKRSGSWSKDSDYLKFARTAKGYKAWDSPDLKRGGVNTYLEDDYSCKLEQSLYDEYLPIRKKYAREAKLQIVRNLNRQRQREELEELKEMKKLKKLRKEIFGDTPKEIVTQND